MKFIAYTYRGGFKESGAHDTREDAARELFAKLGKSSRINSVETAKAVQSHQGHWRQHGMDIQAVRRDQVLDLATLPAKKLHAVIAKREAERGAALDATIAAGMGMMRHAEIEALACGSSLLANTHLAREYLRTRAEWLEAHAELDARKAYHGGDKPIKRAAY